MLNNSIKLFLLCLLIAQCSLKSNNEQSTKVFYTDRENPHAKMQLPVEISWSHDRAGNPNQPINVVITARAFSNLTNAKMNLTFSPNLKLVSGDTSKTLATFTSGTSTELYFLNTVLKYPSMVDSFRPVSSVRYCTCACIPATNASAQLYKVLSKSNINAISEKDSSKTMSNYTRNA